MGNHRYRTIARILSPAAGSLALCLLLLGSGDASAKDPEPLRPPSPLELTEPDPLFSPPPDGRPLTPFERSRLGDNADALAADAQSEYDAGNVDAAFELWYRSLRLRRFLGLAAEIPALGEVGAVAWDARARKFDIQTIGDRLIAIESELPAGDRGLLRALAGAFEQLRLSDRAVVLYEDLLPDLSGPDREDVLLSIARLRQARFNYLSAAAAYETLLGLARDRGDRETQILYLQDLVRLYELAERPQDSALVKEKLLAQYVERSPDDPAAAKKIPALLVSIGGDYAALGRAGLAASTYQDARERALSLKQYAVAGDALDALGELYERADRPEEAARAYIDLVSVQQRSLDRFGLIQTYDRLGELYLAQDDPARALNAFERALELAESLSYEPERFVAQIERARALLP